MPLRSMILAASLSAIAGAAAAHDPMLHEDNHTPKAKPTTCAQYADREHYSNDLTDPDIKVLKDTCDAEKKEAGAKATEAKKD